MISLSINLMISLYVLLSTLKCLTEGGCVIADNKSDTLSKRLPGAIIIGVKKAGTRALLEYLKQNPFVKAPGPEVHYLDRYYRYGIEWYRSRMPLSKRNELTIEKTPSYFITRSVPKRLRKLNPNMKLIVVLRNPVDRALSDYTQNSSKKPRYPPFERLAFVCNESQSECRVNSSWAAIRVGLYYKHLQRWLQYFPMSNFYFVDGDRLINDPVTATNEVERFLNLSVSVDSSHFSRNLTKKFPCLMKKTRCNETIVFKPKCLGSTKGRQHPVVSFEAIDALRRFYFEHNRLLFRLIDRYFDW